MDDNATKDIAEEATGFVSHSINNHADVVWVLVSYQIYFM
jgi:hypothetical protein